ncbi:MAG: hypothetical protein ABSF70_03460 [Terracidiphilus sp.]|jgi:hypothetical protein
MRKFVAVLFLLLCATSLQAKDKPNPADFPIKIHISASQVVYAQPILIFVNTVLNGKKVTLGGYSSGHGVLVSYPVVNPGDYQIRLREDKSEHKGSFIRQEYELLLPDGDTWECWIVGISE